MKKLGWTECDLVELDLDELTATALQGILAPQLVQQPRQDTCSGVTYPLDLAPSPCRWGRAELRGRARGKTKAWQGSPPDELRLLLTAGGRGGRDRGRRLPADCCCSSEQPREACMAPAGSIANSRRSRSWQQHFPDPPHADHVRRSAHDVLLEHAGVAITTRRSS